MAVVNGSTAYVVLVRYRDAASGWRWRKKWVLRTRPANGIASLISRARKTAMDRKRLVRWQQWAKEQEFRHDKLEQRVGEYLHYTVPPLPRHDL